MLVTRSRRQDWRGGRPAARWAVAVGCLLAAASGAAQTTSRAAASAASGPGGPAAGRPLSRIPGVAAPAPQPSAALDQSPQVRALYERARGQLADGQPEQALASLDAALNVAEGDVYELYYLLGLTKFRLGRLGEARAAAEFAARLRPGAADAHYLLGSLYKLQGRLEPATAHFRTATLAAQREAGNPRVTAGWFLLGECLRERGYLLAAAESYERFDEALWQTHPEHGAAAEVKPLLERYPRGALELRLDLLARLGRAALAIRAAEQAAKSRPDDTFLARTYARVLLEHSRAQRAWEYCRRRLEQDWPAARTLLPPAARAAQAAGRAAAWVAALERQIAEDRQLELARRLAQHFARLGAHAEAAALWRALARQRPDDANLAWHLATALQAAGQPGQAFESLSGFVRRHPAAGELLQRRLSDWLAACAAAGATRPFVARRSRRAGRDFAGAFVLGTMAAAAGQQRRAEELLRASLAARPDFALARLVWGRLHLSRCRWQQAEQQAAEALKVAPQLAAAYFVRAEAQAGRDENTAAESAYKTALRLWPADPAFAVGLARLQRRLGNQLGAQRYFQQALTSDPTCAEALEGLVESYVRSGKLELARAALRRAEQLDLPDDVLRRARTAVRFLAAPRGAETLAELLRQFADHPDDAATGLRLAEELFRQQRVAEAAAVAEQARAAAPDEQRALLLLARIDLRRLRYGAAIGALETLAKRYPNRRAVLKLLSRAYLSDFRLPAARRVLRRLLAFKPADEERRVLRGQLLASYREFSEFDAALKLLAEWIAQEPQNNELVQARLETLADAGRSDEALAAAWQRVREAGARLRPLIEQAADGPLRAQYRGLLMQAYQAYLNVCLAAGAFQRGQQQARRWLEQNPHDPALTASLVELLLRAERPAEALRVLEGFVPQAWDAALAARMWRARCLGAAGRTREALAEAEALLAERLVRRDAGLAGKVRELMVDVLGAARQYEQALDRIGKWEAGLPPGPSPERLHLLALKQGVLHAAGRMDEYVRTLEALHEYSPRDPRWNNDLGYTWVDMGRNIARATEMIRQAVAAEPLNAAYLDSLAWARYKAGDFCGARKQLARAVRLRGGQDPLVYDHLADAEYRLGQTQAAREHWQRALRLLEAGAPPQPLPERAALTAQVRAKLQALAGAQRPPLAPTAGEQN